jgi:hypothetical protein
MDERIRELAKDAGYYLYDLTETHECKTVETDSTDEWITLEKFAQLIVKECVSVINTEAAEHEEDDEIERAWKMGTEFAVYQIKQHFGVEE